MLFYDGRQEHERSLEILRAALAEQPDQRIYRGRLAERLRAMGRAEEAEALLLEVTADERPAVAAGAWIDLAKLYQALPERLGPYVFSDRVDTPILAPKHGDSSGVRGAAWLWPLNAEADP